MSFSSHKRNALDARRPLHWRMSSLRSCAMLVGEKYRVGRSEIMERVRQLSGVDLAILVYETDMQVGDDDIRRAVDVLTQLKNSGYDAPTE